MVNHQFVCLYLQDAHHVLKRFGRDGSFLGEIGLPMIGSVVTLNGQREDKELFYAFQSFVCPTTIYRYDFETDASQILFTPPIQFDFSPYVTRQVFATSKDGTRVPMFLVHRQELTVQPRSPRCSTVTAGSTYP